MLKFLIIFFSLVIGSMMYFYQSLQNGVVLNFIDKHPKTRGIPAATYYIGQGYYLFHDLQDSATYFLRVAQRYPDSSVGEDGYFSYLQSLDDSMVVSRQDLVLGYQAYLEKYPEGKHSDLVKTRLDYLRTGAH